MAKYRQLHITFWQDPFVENLKPLEKYFYIYLMTNSKTTQCGCYEISDKLIMYETGLTEKQISDFILMLESKNKIRYNRTNMEFLILNWLKHNSFKSPKVITCINNEIEFIKTEEFKQYINGFIVGEYPIDRLSKTIDTQSQEEEEEEEKKKKTPLEISIDEFINHRKIMKKPMSNRAIKLFTDELNKIFETDEQKIAGINESILRGWMTVYPPKEQKLKAVSNSDYVDPNPFAYRGDK